MTHRFPRRALLTVGALAPLASLLAACGSSLRGEASRNGHPAPEVASSPPGSDEQGRANLTHAMTAAPTSTATTGAAPPRPRPTAPAANLAVLPPRVVLAWARTATPGSLRLPAALAVNRAGHLHVVDAGAHQIRVFDRDGRDLATWGGPGNAAGRFRFREPDRCDGSEAFSCTLDLGGGLAIDGRGDVYVADCGNHRLQRFDQSGRWLASWGREGNEPGEFRLPSGIAVADDGLVFVSDSGNDRLQVFDQDGRYQTSWGSQGTAAGQFLAPRALAVDRSGTVFVADTWSGRVQRFDRHGRLLGGWRLALDAPGYDQPRPRVTAIAVDAHGQVTVGGVGLPIQTFDASGRLLVSWPRLNNGIWPSPVGLAADEGSDILLADRDSRQILRYTILTPATS